MKTEYIAFNYGELELPVQALLDCHHQGACDADVDEWANEIDWDSQTMGPVDIRKELEECGAWDDEELSDDELNQKRILWIAAGNYQEELLMV